MVDRPVVIEGIRETTLRDKWSNEESSEIREGEHTLRDKWSNRVQ